MHPSKTIKSDFKKEFAKKNVRASIVDAIFADTGVEKDEEEEQQQTEVISPPAELSSNDELVPLNVRYSLARIALNYGALVLRP